MTRNEDSLVALGGALSVIIDHPKAWPDFSDEARAAVDAQLISGDVYGYGDAGVIQRLEDEIRRYHNGVPYVIALGSGTCALHSAYVGICIDVGDEVIVPVYTYVATVTPLFLCGAIPVLCDIERDTGNIDPSKIRQLVTAKTRAIVVTHLWGHPAEMDEILEIAREYGLKVIEDCSHAHGSRYKGRSVGTIGDVGIFSMGAGKMVTGGMGGALMTRDVDVFERALVLGHCRGRAGQTLVTEKLRWLADVGLGANYRINLLSATLCLDQFISLDRRLKEKHSVLNLLAELLEKVPGLRPPATRPYVSRGAWYGFRAEFISNELSNLSIDRFFKVCSLEGLKLRHPRSEPLHMLPPFNRKTLGFYPADLADRRTYQAGDFPVAEEFYANSVSFPTKHLHKECTDLLVAYSVVLHKVARFASLL